MDTPTISYVYLTSKSAQCWVPVRWCEGFKEAKITGCLFVDLNLTLARYLFTLLNQLWSVESKASILNLTSHKFPATHQWEGISNRESGKTAGDVAAEPTIRTGLSSYLAASAVETEIWRQRLFPALWGRGFSDTLFGKTTVKPFGTANFLEEIWRYSFAAKLFWLIIEISEVDTSQVHFQIYVKLPMTSMKSSTDPRWLTWPTRNSHDTISWHQKN